MTFISYAQNFEDVMLWRAFQHIKNGFFIDVGAQDPVVDSVTKAFYDVGWQGINIEPTDQYYQRLVKARPGDINIKAVVRSKSGDVLLHEFADTGMSTTHDDIANLHKSNGWEVCSDVVVPAITLEQICEEHGVDTIHFLKIDVEGDEREVLEGFSFNKLRPWVVIAEATAPNTNNDISADWLQYLIDRNYKCVYFDGLNKFFVADEHKELLSAFALPPNVIDGFMTAPMAMLRKQNGEMKSENEELLHQKEQVIQREAEQDKKLQEYEQQTISLMAQIDQANLLHRQAKDQLSSQEAHLNAIYQSSSWRLTKPFRFLRTKLRL